MIVYSNVCSQELNYKLLDKWQNKTSLWACPMPRSTYPIIHLECQATPPPLARPLPRALPGKKWEVQQH